MEPGAGRMASGASGRGPPARDARRSWARCAVLLGRGGPLAGRRVVITAGGTQEPIDPVRYIGNRSSGQMGWALAEAALRPGRRRHADPRPGRPAAALRRHAPCRCGPRATWKAAVRAAVPGPTR